MSLREIRQAITSDCLLDVLAGWCKIGSGGSHNELRILSAFVSAAAMRALSPLVDVFLSHGNHVEIIVGIDRGGTDRNAIRFLRALKKAYINQVDVSVFHAPARNSIFHPKLYIMETKSSVNFVVGSANLTVRSEEHTSELQSHSFISYAVF